MRFLTLVALASTLPCVTAAACSAQMPTQAITISKENRTIAITATDNVIAMADLATVHIGYAVYGADHDSAYATGSRTSNAIIDALKAAGVSSDAIESENQNISEVQPYQVNQASEAEKAKRKFMTSQSWTVRTSANDAARVLDIAVKAGANQSGQIEWSLKDENAAQAQAAGKALQHARIVAEEMAKGMNVKLGVLVFASNETQAVPVRPVMMAMSAKAAAPVMPLAINARRIEKSATVYAVFAIE